MCLCLDVRSRSRGVDHRTHAEAMPDRAGRARRISRGRQRARDHGRARALPGAVSAPRGGGICYADPMTQRVTIHVCGDELAYFLDDVSDDWEDVVDEEQAARVLQSLLEAELTLPPGVEVDFVYGTASLQVDSPDPTIRAAVEAALDAAWDALDERADEVGAALLPPEPAREASPPPSPPSPPSLDEIEARLDTDTHPQYLLDPLVAAGLVAAIADPAQRERARDLAERVVRVTDRLDPPVATVLSAMRGAEREGVLVRDVVRGAAGGMKHYDPDALFAAVDHLAELDPEGLRVALLERLRRCEDTGQVILSGLPGLCRARRGTGDREVVEAMLAAGERFERAHHDGALWHAVRAIGGATEAEREALIAAWPEGRVDRTLALWQQRGWDPARVAGVLRGHGVPVRDDLPAEWPLDGEEALRAVLGERLGYAEAGYGQGRYQAFLDTIAGLLPDDEELHEMLDEEESCLHADDVAFFFERAGRPERVLFLEKTSYPWLAVLAPEAGLRSAAAELGLWLNDSPAR